jgi:hypothetical protein
MAPLAARADDFCSSLQKIISDAPNGFNNIASAGEDVPAKMQIAGFTGCTVNRKAGAAAMYICLDMGGGITFDAGAAVTQCLSGWTFLMGKPGDNTITLASQTAMVSYVKLGTIVDLSVSPK